VSQKTVVVTGAAGGFGIATVRRFKAEGWKVYGWDVVLGDVEGVEWRKVDVADEDAVREAAKEVGECHILANIAGTTSRGRISDVSARDWKNVVAINLFGTFHCCQALFPQLAAVRGLVVNIGSIRVYRPGMSRTAYAAAKAGVHGFTRALGIEWGSVGIRVIGISPSHVRTPRQQANIDAGKFFYNVVKERMPLGRMAEPEEIAEMILALEQPAFAFVTGTMIDFDGGWLAADIATDADMTSRQQLPRSMAGAT
jgi:meso-butanediol dehydrogenase/(S,S)-butanediol dehydrogenase/diacetyl reductase